ncbi:hypothetical protein [Amycolatopsis sp. NPDC051128]|uniref:hypothetical protein n=1 Tax=Amycolatopsis sp. NPDC051128 TaxID=3155412 RepID=UPI003438058D
MTYDAGPGWTRSADALPLGPANFELESFGPSRCVNVERPVALLGRGLVSGTQDVDGALTKVLREGLLNRLFGLRAMAVGGLPHDIRAGTTAGRGATIFIAEQSCIPADLAAAPVVLDLRGYPVHDPDGVAVVFLVGTLPDDARDRILTSVRVTR